MFPQFCVPLFTTLRIQQQLLCLLFLCLHPLHKQSQLLDNCSTDLHTTIIILKHTVSSHKTDWTSLTHSPALSLSFIWQSKQFDEYYWRRMFVDSPFRILYKCKHRCLIIVYIYSYRVCSCLPFFMLVFVVVFLFTILVLSDVKANTSI